MQTDMGCATITTNPSGAKILVDGKLMTDRGGNPVKTPTKLELFTGQRYIELDLEGYFADFSYAYIYPSCDINIERNLSKIPLSMGKIIRYNSTTQIPPEVVGNLVITTYPAGATINMDGKTVIDTETKEPLKTPVELVVPMGLHNFIFKLAGYCDEFAPVYITPRSTQYVHNDFYVC